MDKLSEKASLKDLISAYNSLLESKKRDRGPESTRDMTEDDARSLNTEEFRNLSHKDAAKKLGLSYGQIYSARKGFTFKKVIKAS